MAYNTIVVNIGPNREDSEWSNLASGVGLRYVRHLEIRSSFVNDDKPKRAEDLVAGTLIAAARRNTLHTFKLVWKSLYEIKHTLTLVQDHFICSSKPEYLGEDYRHSAGDAARPEEPCSTGYRE